jgi:hypothetical protein
MSGEADVCRKEFYRHWLTIRDFGSLSGLINPCQCACRGASVSCRNWRLGVCAGAKGTMTVVGWSGKAAKPAAEGKADRREGKSGGSAAKVELVQHGSASSPASPADQRSIVPARSALGLPRALLHPDQVLLERYRRSSGIGSRPSTCSFRITTRRRGWRRRNRQRSRILGSIHHHGPPNLSRQTAT